MKKYSPMITGLLTSLLLIAATTKIATAQVHKATVIEPGTRFTVYLGQVQNEQQWFFGVGRTESPGLFLLINQIVEQNQPILFMRCPAGTIPLMYPGRNYSMSFPNSLTTAYIFDQPEPLPNVTFSCTQTGDTH